MLFERGGVGGGGGKRTAPDAGANDCHGLLERFEPDDVPRSTGTGSGAADHLGCVVHAAEAQKPREVDEQEAKEARLGVDIEPDEVAVWQEEGVGWTAAATAVARRGRGTGSGLVEGVLVVVLAQEADEGEEGEGEQDVRAEADELDGRPWGPHAE